MRELSESKEEDLQKKLTSLHSKFLESIKEVYPLAVLGSLCVAISAFAHQSYPEAQACALVSASLFLGAFVFSLLFKILKFDPLALMSYISTALAVLLLFVTIFQFSVNVPMMSRAFLSIVSFLGWIFYASLYYSVAKSIRRAGNRLSRASAWTSVFCGVVTLALFTINDVSFILGGEGFTLGTSWFFVTVLFFAVSLAFSLISLYLTRKERKMKSTNTLSKNPVQNRELTS